MSSSVELNSAKWGSNNTTLHLASFLGEIAIIQAIIAKGGKITIKNDLGLEPLDVAADADTQNTFKSYISKTSRQPAKKFQRKSDWQKSSLPNSPDTSFQSIKNQSIHDLSNYCAPSSPVTGSEQSFTNSFSSESAVDERIPRLTLRRGLSNASTISKRSDMTVLEEKKAPSKKRIVGIAVNQIESLMGNVETEVLHDSEESTVRKRKSSLEEMAGSSLVKNNMFKQEAISSLPPRLPSSIPLTTVPTSSTATKYLKQRRPSASQKADIPSVSSLRRVFSVRKLMRRESSGNFSATSIDVDALSRAPPLSKTQNNTSTLTKTLSKESIEFPTRPNVQSKPLESQSDSTTKQPTESNIAEEQLVRPSTLRASKQTARGTVTSINWTGRTVADRKSPSDVLASSVNDNTSGLVKPSTIKAQQAKRAVQEWYKKESNAIQSSSVEALPAAEDVERLVKPSTLREKMKASKIAVSQIDWNQSARKETRNVETSIAESSSTSTQEFPYNVKPSTIKMREQEQKRIGLKDIHWQTKKIGNTLPKSASTLSVKSNSSQNQSETPTSEVDKDPLDFSKIRGTFKTLERVNQSAPVPSELQVLSVSAQSTFARDHSTHPRLSAIKATELQQSMQPVNPSYVFASVKSDSGVMLKEMCGDNDKPESEDSTKASDVFSTKFSSRRKNMIRCGSSSSVVIKEAEEKPNVDEVDDLKEETDRFSLNRSSSPASSTRSEEIESVTKTYTDLEVSPIKLDVPSLNMKLDFDWGLDELTSPSLLYMDYTGNPSAQHPQSKIEQSATPKQGPYDHNDIGMNSHIVAPDYEGDIEGMSSIAGNVADRSSSYMDRSTDSDISESEDEQSDSLDDTDISGINSSMQVETESMADTSMGEYYGGRGSTNDMDEQIEHVETDHRFGGIPIPKIRRRKVIEPTNPELSSVPVVDDGLYEPAEQYTTTSTRREVSTDRRINNRPFNYASDTRSNQNKAEAFTPNGPADNTPLPKLYKPRTSVRNYTPKRMQIPEEFMQAANQNDLDTYDDRRSDVNLNVRPNTLKEEDFVTPMKKDKPKKSVQFGASWNGSLETTKKVIGNRVSSEVRQKSTSGRLLLQVGRIFGLDSLASKKDLIYIYAVVRSEQHNVVTKSQMVLNRDIGIHDDIAIQIPETGTIQLDIRLHIESKSGSVSSVSKAFFSAAAKKLFSKPTQSFKSSTSPISNSDDFLRPSGMSVKDNSKDETIARFIIDLNSLNRELKSGVVARTWDCGTKFGSIKVETQMFFLRGARSEDETLPKSIEEVVEIINNYRSWNDNIWMEGFLSQLGGDQKFWKRRFYQLEGCLLIPFNESRQAREPIDLRLCTAIITKDSTISRQPNSRYDSSHDDLYEPLTVPHSFRLIFKWDEKIDFYADDDDHMRKWIERLREVHAGAMEEIPEWLSDL
ncbi:hypothetical protein BKA69DRAFT_771630 [Paraphysoderma sedebokerense]|nr:hypothetical protein BKA69DRAFT_771630 [Paraphysoderma sedebokerense]